MTGTKKESLDSRASKLPGETGVLENGEVKYSDDIYYTQHIVYPPRNTNPSLAMRLRDIEYQTSKECVSMGRGYINTESVKNRYVMKGGRFTCQSNGWEDKVLKIDKCSVCGLVTAENLKYASRIYCSDDCAVESYAKESGSSEKSIFDLFRPGEIGTVEIRKEVVNGRAPCSVILQSQQSLYERLNTLSKTAEELFSFRAEKGDYVLVEDEKKVFKRGMVVDMDPDGSSYKIGLIDRSEIVEVNEVFATTEYLEKEISFGGVITFIGNENPQSKLIKFRARERGPFGIWHCDVLESSENDDITEIVLEEWVPPLEINSIPLESGCAVVITQYLDVRTMYVKRIDSPWNEECVRYNNDIAAYCVEAKKYKTIPRIGEICCVRYAKDGSYYRGVVRGIENDLAVMWFPDYGTEQLTDVSDLRYLPALAKQVPAFSRLIKLKDINQDSTPEAIHYLNRMTAYSCELVLIKEGNENSEVMLMDKYSGEILNHVIHNYEIPTWVKNRHAFSKSGEIYDYTTMQEVSFTCGETEDVYVLNFDESSFRNQGIFWGTVNRSDYLGHLKGELKEKMAEFCGHMVEDRYLPRIGELCIALYRGEWSRALCVEEKDVICKLTFIDHGTSFWVETKDIRKILKEFLEMPALALKCAVSDIQKMEKSKKDDLVAYVKSMTEKAIPGVKILKRLGEVYYLSVTVPADFDVGEVLSGVETSIFDGTSKNIVGITCTCPAGGITCNDAILKIKDCIDFKTLEIEEPQLRKVSTNTLVVQVEGENCRDHARILVDQLENIFADRGVNISCLTAGKIKISGLWEGMTREEIAEEVAEIAGIKENEVQVNTYVKSGRMSVAWLRCPLATAIDLAEKGTIAVGSSPVRVELQHRRPVRCFRCLREGHIGSQCSFKALASKCFRCSQTGHKAIDCIRRPFCDLCKERGYPAAHRIGSGMCQSREDNLNELDLDGN